MKAVDRTEIADCLEDAFVGQPLSSSDLVEFAAAHGARSPVLQVLDRLDGPSYRNLRELWRELADVPVER
jgi:hypothetical protein